MPRPRDQRPSDDSADDWEDGVWEDDADPDVPAFLSAAPTRPGAGRPAARSADDDESEWNAGPDLEEGVDPAEVIAECRARFTDAPREFGAELRATLKWPMAKWMWLDGPFRSYMFARKELLRDGVVVWGALLQANMLMFDPREEMSCPGEFVFCPDPRRRIHPAEILEVASRVQELKHTKPRDPELRKFADYLTDERTRAFGWPVPRKLSAGVPCVVSSTLFPRHYLPGNAISGQAMPVVVLPHEPHYACILHRGFWPREFRTVWRNGG